MTKKRHLSSSVIVSSTINSTTFLQKAEALALKLGLEFIAHADKSESDLLLCYTHDGLKLLHRDHLHRPDRYLLFVDFVHGPQGYRLARNRTIKQPLAKAVGIKPGCRPNIFDATAGLGGDSFVFASLGCTVVLAERNPVISALLEDGMQRASLDTRTMDIITKKMTLIAHDSREYLQGKQETFETIYLDPMYPHRNSSALSKQSMRTVRKLVGDDDDSSDLIEASLGSGASRIVVKRPKVASPLTSSTPDHVIKMKSSRFDIYFPRSKNTIVTGIKG